MPTSPSDIFALAQHLHDNIDTEAARRSAISRAYYAALLEAQATFTQGERIGNESSHAVIIGSAKAYGNGPNPGRSEASVIALWLGRMRTKRNEADYQLNTSCTEQDAAGMMARAQDILSRCDTIRQRQAQTAAAQSTEQGP